MTPLRALAPLAALLPALVGAEPASVVSPAPEHVALTIYGDDLALVRETRTVELPEGFAIVEFRGVSDAIVPRAAIVEGIDGIVERNFDYDLLSPYSLVSEAVGSEVTLVRTNPGTGAVTHERARVVSGGEGVVLDFGDGRIEALECSGLPEGLVFDAPPPGLRAEPTLSARVHSKRAGRQELTLVYLAHGIAWRADYIVRVAQDGGRFDLEAWITLANESATSFPDAHVAVVAGELNRQDDGREIIPRAQLEDHCWAWGRRWPGFWSRGFDKSDIRMSVSALAEESIGGIEEIIVTANKRAEVTVTEAQREALLDYYLYRVPWETTVAAQQSKQVRFLTKRGVRFEHFYSFADFYGQDASAEPEPEPASIYLRFFNRKRDGLGEPLPEGDLRIMQATAQGETLLVGEASIDNTAEDLPVELELGQAVDVQDRVTITEHRERPRLLSALRGEPAVMIQARVEHELTNAKPVAVTVELRQWGDRLRVSGASHPWAKDRGYPIWRIEVPANGSVIVRYRVRMDE